MRYLRDVVFVTADNLPGHLTAGRQPGTLYIADRRGIAGKLTQNGYPVLIRLHEGNRGEDFSAWRYACENPEDADDDYLEGVYRHLVRLPWDILETERLSVRETTEADVDDFYGIYADPEITRYTEPLYPERERELAYARDYIDQVYAFYGFGIWTVTLKSTGAVIGRAGICYREGYDDPELGFIIGKKYQRRGYATEVCRAILDYAVDTLGFARILAFVRPENEASVRVCRNLSMEPVETVRINDTEYTKYCYTPLKA